MLLKIRSSKNFLIACAVAALGVADALSHLSAAEKTELDHYLHVEHITRLAKARARQQLKAWAILS